MKRFNAMTGPLTGSCLIEASAGTGKTYAIAWLFLRLLIERRLEVRQILVVTFTTAATAELRDRIRLLVRRAGPHPTAGPQGGRLFRGRCSG